MAMAAWIFSVAQVKDPIARVAVPPSGQTALPAYPKNYILRDVDPVEQLH